MSHIEKDYLEFTVAQEERNQSYEKLHRAILHQFGENVCSYYEGLRINAIIDNVEFKHKNSNDKNQV